MDTSTRQAVVVGLDRSDPGRAAVQFAADLASRRKLRLHVIHAFEPSQYAVRPPMGVAIDVDGVLRNSAQRLVHDTVEVLGAVYPELELSTELHPGSATQRLLEASQDAEAIVLGSRGTGGFADLVIGSTTLHVASHAGCPVWAVPAADDGQARSGVVVGVDGSQVSEAAIGYAFEVASDIGDPLTAVHAWYDSTRATAGMLLPLGYDRTEEERLLLAESMAGWQEKYPDVKVTSEVVVGHPVPVLVSASARARVVVVGSHGRGSVRSIAMGSVSHGVLHRAGVPVAVVHPTRGRTAY